MRRLLPIALIWLTAAVPAGAAGLPFIQDDFAQARAQAIERKLPIFIECWAPW